MARRAITANTASEAIATRAEKESFRNPSTAGPKAPATHPPQLGHGSQYGHMVSFYCKELP